MHFCFTIFSFLRPPPPICGDPPLVWPLPCRPMIVMLYRDSAKKKDADQVDWGCELLESALCIFMIILFLSTINIENCKFGKFRKISNLHSENNKSLTILGWIPKEERITAKKWRRRRKRNFIFVYASMYCWRCWVMERVEILPNWSILECAFTW